MTQGPDVIWLRDVGKDDVAVVGGKNASLGEMLSRLGSAGVRVPDGFATTACGYRTFIEANRLGAPIGDALAAHAAGRRTLAETGAAIREHILAGEWPERTAEQIRDAYRQLSMADAPAPCAVAVRSSATAEDLPDASFAGQQETFLNVVGEDALLDAAKRCYASLFTNRAISYREAKGFDHLAVALSVGVQRMVRSDRAGAGVMFSIDTETGFDGVVLIDAAYGLGELVVQGSVDPDSYQVFKPLLEAPGITPIIDKTLGAKTEKLIYAAADGNRVEKVPTSKAERRSFVLEDAEIIALARWAVLIERHYGRPMDIEWAKDGRTGELFIVQARPETVVSRKRSKTLSSYRLGAHGDRLVSGIAIGDAVASGRAALIEDPRDSGNFPEGAILVAATTDPDWVPVMKQAAAVVTDHGGRTSHAAIVSRELGVPAVVGTGNATDVLHDRQEVTVSCAEGSEGFVYEGRAEVSVDEIDPGALPVTRTNVMLNLANPAAAFRWWRLPSDGVGLARMEFVISNHVRVHPMALAHLDAVPDPVARRAIDALTDSYDQPTDYFVDSLSRGLARIAAAVYPKPAIVRMSDFKTNEYAGLLGGASFEALEANPMIGFRGAARYVSDRYRDGFALECRAIHRLRQDFGFDNVVVMIPFCRSVAEADEVLAIMEENGIGRGTNGLEVYVMAEIPSNVVLANAFAERFDGFSIGSNDLTQLTLGVDRDNEALASAFDEQDPAVKWMIRSVIEAAHKAGAKIGLCGQAPSDHPEFARFLVDCGIDSISVSPDSFAAVKCIVARAEAGEA